MWKLVKAVYYPMRKRDKFTKEEHNEIANMEYVEVASTPSQTDAPARKTSKMKLPGYSFTVGYGNTSALENVDRLTSEPASNQVVDERIINVLSKDGIQKVRQKPNSINHSKYPLTIPTIVYNQLLFESRPTDRISEKVD